MVSYYERNCLVRLNCSRVDDERVIFLYTLAYCLYENNY